MGWFWKVLLLFALLAAAPAMAAEPWRQASSAHFVIYAQYDTAALRQYAERLERFDKALRVLRRLPDDPVGDANRLTVFIVQNDETVAKLAGAAGSDIVGFYRGRAGGSLVVSSREKRQHWAEAPPQVVLLHEYAHHFMLRHFPAAYPAWFREGFAEFYSTARFAADGSMEIGAPANHRAYELAVVREPDVALMLADPANARGVGSMELYGYGWLLTHYLTFNEGRKGQLASYLDAINRGVPAGDAAFRAFGNLKQLERDVRTYLSKRHMKIATVTAAELGIAAVAVRDLAPGEAAMMPTWIRTRLVEPGQGDRDVAADARRVAARLPQEARVAEMLAEAELAGGNLNAADAAADVAIAADAGSLRGLVIKSEVALRRAAAGTADAKALSGRIARSVAMKANRIDPDNPVPLMLFYRSLAAAGDTPTRNAVTGLTRAHLLAPEDGDLRLMLARQMIADAKPQEARLLLTPIAYDPHGGTRRTAAVALLGGLPPATAAASPPGK